MTALSLYIDRYVPGGLTLHFSTVAGFILAVSGLGAALFPWMMGIVSTHSGSLRIAMAVPFVLATALLALSIFTANAVSHRRTLGESSI